MRKQHLYYEGDGCVSLTHISLVTFCGISANSAKPDHTPQNEASDQVLHCLLTVLNFFQYIELRIVGHVMVLFSPDWTNIGFSFILLYVNLFHHPTTLIDYIICDHL